MTAEAVRGRVRWVDVLKGVLILLVIFGHAVQGLAADAMLAAHPQVQGIRLVKDVIYGFHMPAFFVVSGFFAGGLWRKDLARELKKKLRRLVKPYFIWGFLTACGMQVMSSFTNKGEGLMDFLRSPVVPFSQFWYLYVLFFMFLLHCGLSAVLRRYADRALLCLSIVLYVAEPLVPDVWMLQDFCSHAVYYALGMFVFSPLNVFASGAGGASSAGRVTSVGSASSAGKASSTGGPSSLTSYKSEMAILLGMQGGASLLYGRCCSFLGAAMGFGGAYATSVLMSNTNGAVTTALERFGAESLALYVTHLLAVQGLRIVLVRLLHVSNLWLVALTATVLGSSLCWAFIQITKRIGLYRFLF